MADSNDRVCVVGPFIDDHHVEEERARVRVYTWFIFESNEL